MPTVLTFMDESPWEGLKATFITVATGDLWNDTHPVMQRKLYVIY